MPSPARGMLWQLWNRHKVGLILSAAWLLLEVLIYPPILRTFVEYHVFVSTLSMIPLVLVVTFLANLLLFTDEPGSMSSGYPRRMFTLPVPTRTLVLWPMLYAAILITFVWLVVALLVYGQAGYHPPLLLPGMAAVGSMAWCQAIGWTPIRMQTLKILGAIVGLGLLLGLPTYLFLSGHATTWIIAGLGGIEILMVFGLALLAVRHDRRGEDWTAHLQAILDAVGRARDHLTPQPKHFLQAEAAQLWYESRCHTVQIQAVMALVLLSNFAICLILLPEKPLALPIVLGSLLAIPLLMAGTLGGSAGRMRPPGSSQSPFITFLATRPMRDGALIHAKYLMIARIVVSIWILDLVLILALVLVRGKTAEVAALFQGFLNLYPGGRGPVILGLLVVLVPVFTWKLLADGLVFGLTGRGWLADSSTVIGVSSLMLMLTAGLWVSAEPSRLLWFPPFLVGALAVLAIVKLVVAVAAFRVAWRRGLVAGTAIGGIAATWTVLATATMTLAGLLLPGTGLHVSTPLVQVASLLTLPLGRFALAPLALDWNRHR